MVPLRPEEAIIDVQSIAYGDHPDQVLDLYLPGHGVEGRPAVALVHGGFWWERYRADGMAPLAEDLAGRGHVVANIEYRRVGGDGGWPSTFLDVAAAFDHLATVPEVPPEHVVAAGHSAGGQLALWAAGRHRLPDGAPGAGPRLQPCAVIASAPVADLSAAAAAGLGRGAVVDLLGGRPQEVPDRYAAADPVALLPLGVPVVLVHGEDDPIVPPQISAGYAEHARAAGDRVEVVTLPGDHFQAIDPAHPLWAAVADRLRDL